LEIVAIVASVLTIETSAFPTEGFEVDWASYTVTCRRSVAGLAAWVAIGALELNLTFDCELTNGTCTLPTEGFEVAWAS
jgi:hypothetical protein